MPQKSKSELNDCALMEDEMKTKQDAKKSGYVRPQMRTVVTPKEIRDIDQPCAFYTRRATKSRRKPK